MKASIEDQNQNRGCEAAGESPQPLRKEDYERLSSFRHTLRRYLRFSGEAAAKAGLSPRQHQALLAIKGSPGSDSMTVGELAEQLQIQPNSAVGLVDRLAAEGYVERRHDSADRRKVSVLLTGQGSAVLEKLTAAHREELYRTVPKLGALLQAIVSSPRK